MEYLFIVKFNEVYKLAKYTAHAGPTYTVMQNWHQIGASQALLTKQGLAPLK
jgi:hypothetical protein